MIPSFYSFGYHFGFLHFFGARAPHLVFDDFEAGSCCWTFPSRLRDSCFPSFGFLWLFLSGHHSLEARVPLPTAFGTRVSHLLDSFGSSLLGPVFPCTAFGTRDSQFELFWLSFEFVRIRTLDLEFVDSVLQLSFWIVLALGLVFPTFLPLRLRGS